jgi:hypothetical protein
MPNVATLTVCFALLMSHSNSLAAPVGSAFTYQGQLKGGGVPASGAFRHAIQAV